MTTMSDLHDGKWHTIFGFEKDPQSFNYGWRIGMIGFIKMTSLPPEGQPFGKENYKGFMLVWRYWLPWERA